MLIILMQSFLIMCFTHFPYTGNYVWYNTDPEVGHIEHISDASNP